MLSRLCMRKKNKNNKERGNKKNNEDKTRKIKNPISPKILIVDDIHLNAKLLANYLTMYGFFEDSIYMVHSGEDCIRFIEENKDTDIIFMDVKMFGLDGHKTTKILRDNKFEGVIIGITGLVSPDMIELGIKSGMDFIHPKPIMSDELMLIFKKIGVCINKL